MTFESEISVILPVFNSERYVAKAIESILCQSFSNFQLVIIDDGSTDKSAEIISGFSDPRIHFHQNDKNLGLITTLNIGLNLAKGEFIARMDADDIAMPDRFEKQITFLQNSPNTGICGSHFITIGQSKNHAPELPCSSEEIRLTLLFRSAMAHPTVMFRKNVVDQFHLRYNPDFPSAEDYKLWTDFALHTNLCNLKDVLLQYRVHDGQITQTKIDQKESSLKKVQFDFLSSTGIDASHEEMEIHYRLSGGRGARNLTELEDTLSWLTKLRLHLLEIKFASQIKIENCLTNEFRRAAENSGLGLKAFRLWQKCTWKISNPTMKDTIRFYFKILTLYKAH